MIGFDPDKNRMRSAARASAIGIEMAGSILGGLLLGWWADEKLGTGSVLTLIGLLLGTFGAGLALYRLVKSMGADTKDES